MFQDGADIVDIGATSTSYNASLLSAEEEWAVLEPLLSKISDSTYDKAIWNFGIKANDIFTPQDSRSFTSLSNISLDTFYFENAKKALKFGIGYINDVSGGSDLRMLELIASNPSVKYIMMYSLVLPANKDVRVSNLQEIHDWMSKQSEKCVRFGIQKSQIILDPGIGFTTTQEQSFQVIQNISEYKKIGYKICVGHSRKSFLEDVSNLPAQERDIETLAASLYMFNQKVDYVRVHNVALHKRAINIFNKLSPF